MSAFDNIPLEMRQYRQWINWRYDFADGKETKIPIRSLDGHKASVTNPLDWNEFDYARNVAETKTYEHNGNSFAFGLGFVFTKSDPYTGVDLDNKNHDETIHARQIEIHRQLDSYSEFSPSGNGIHIITRAALAGMGKRKGGIECYDTSRYFTFTGNIYNAVLIADRQQQIDVLWSEIKGDEIRLDDATGHDTETLTDQQVLEHARAAVNGAKFDRLWNGNWKIDFGDHSRSEADQALVNMISFYSRNNTQIARMFRQSPLGSRIKSHRDDYVGGMVRKSFDRTVPVPKFTVVGKIWFDATNVEPWTPVLDAYQFKPMQTTTWVQSVSSPIIVPSSQSIFYSNEEDPGRPLDFADPIPPITIPGIVGDLVNHCWSAAIHQIAEVAIGSALSTMSLLCSRSYRHGSMGLSLYLLLLAQTSTGKSFAYQANDARFNAMIARYNSLGLTLLNGTVKYSEQGVRGKAFADKLSSMVMGEIGSAQGLAQQMPDAPSTLAQLDEYVETIKIMAQQNPPPHMAQIRAELLKLMEMSGPGRIYRGRKYSKRSTTAAPEVDVISASLSILATGTPEQFYDELSSSLLTGGFLPRWTILDYTGGLTRRNENVNREIPKQLMDNLIFLFDKAMSIGATLRGDPNEFIDVMPDREANEYLNWFDNVCYRQVEVANNNGTNMAGMWSRCKDHVRQVASLIAIGASSSPDFPLITREHVGIAINIVRPSVDKIQTKVTTRQTGLGDDRLEAEIKRFVKRVIDGGWGAFRGYPNCKKDLLDAGFIQTSLVRNYCMGLAPFRNHRLGSARSFDNALSDLVKYGVLMPAEGNFQKCLRPNMEHFR